MGTRVDIVFYSMYGHTYRLAVAEAEGAQEVADTEVQLSQVQELVPEDVLEKSGAKQARAEFARVPLATPGELAQADAVIFGTPTRFGNMSAQMRNFIDQFGPLWFEGAFSGKVGSVFTSTGSLHGGQETTITSVHTTLLHLGMIVVGLPYSEEPALFEIDAAEGGTPYGASTIAAPDGSREPTERELKIARTQGRYVAEIARALKRGREE